VLTEFRAARLPQELRSLVNFDRRVFPPGDVFPPSYWRELDSWWMLVNGVKVGCSAFAPHVDFRDGEPEPLQGSLYIASTGIHPAWQGRGFGSMLKAWQVCYARQYGFHRIVTNTRKRNAAMIRLNRKFHFRTIRTTPGYYRDPKDAAVVMELRLNGPDRT
jgi:ribosomal protein S18 acetylase RimI-like enzyme